MDLGRFNIYESHADIQVANVQEDRCAWLNVHRCIIIIDTTASN